MKIGMTVTTTSLCWLLAVTILVVPFLATPASSDDEFDRKSLVGLKGVGVVIEQVSSEAEKDGLSRSTLQTDVELKLRQAGILVLTEDDRLTTPGAPYLYLNANTLKLQSGLYAYDVELFLKQDVFLTRAPKMRITGATTWEASGVTGAVSPNSLGRLREKVRDLVDEFVNAYLAANPKR